MPSLIKTGRLIKELLASSTALLTATLVAGYVAQSAASVKNTQFSSPLDNSKTALQTVDKRRRHSLGFDCEDPISSLENADLTISKDSLALVNELAIAHGGYDAMKLWNEKDAQALNSMSELERKMYLSRLLDETRIGSQLSSIVFKNDGKFHKFDHRFKAPASVYETLHVRPDTPKNIEEISDLIRFSVLFDNQNYTKSTINTLHALEDRGFEVISIWNAWTDHKYPYNAINTILADGAHGNFELQFHTPQGARINDSTHKMYEERRLYPKGSAEYQRLLKSQVSIAALTMVPKDVEQIVNFKHPKIFEKLKLAS